MYSIDTAFGHPHFQPLMEMNGGTIKNESLYSLLASNGSSFGIENKSSNVKSLLNIAQMREEKQNKFQSENSAIITDNISLHLSNFSLGQNKPEINKPGNRSSRSRTKRNTSPWTYNSSKLENQNKSPKIQNRTVACGVDFNEVPVKTIPKSCVNEPTSLPVSLYESISTPCVKPSSDKTIKTCLTPEMAMKLYFHKLSAYEHQEILNYPYVYFVGHNAKKRNGILGTGNNCGYDDDQGSYIHSAHDHVAYRYEVLKILGRGSFGQVVKAYDHKDGVYVALKMVRNERRFTNQATEEIRILEQLKKQDVDNTRNVVHISEHFTFRGHVCITFELLSINLYELIKRSKFQGFPLPLVRKFAHSILVCLDMLHRNKIIHCDLKPENILLKQQGRSGIKVIDFGSSCYESQRLYTYIQSRFYRAPEVILGCKYGLPIDMWSFGCILAELLTGAPIFPGEDEGDQLACIIELLGMPPQKLLDQCRRVRSFFSATYGYPRYCMAMDANGCVVLRSSNTKRGKIRGTPGSRSLVTALKGCEDTVFLDFIRKCLRWTPEERMTPREAFKHEWLRRKLPKPPGARNMSSNVSNPNTINKVTHTTQLPHNISTTISTASNTTTTISVNTSISINSLGKVQSRVSKTECASKLNGEGCVHQIENSSVHAAVHNSCDSTKATAPYSITSTPIATIEPRSITSVNKSASQMYTNSEITPENKITMIVTTESLQDVGEKRLIREKTLCTDNIRQSEHKER
ncbi:unnamed protein product [Schistosoma rodhaini]|uniref:dual-specificity kinase n=1 Tax=Schistosoma rodhaini TaxID=6188 RepID=A0AA85F8J1_9TREM|nr:unnamed protein product [Schistosoma rodhaini]